MKKLAQKVHEVSDRVDNLTQVFDELMMLVKDLTSPYPCDIDNRGYCVMHGWENIDIKCPHARAKTFLENND